MVKTSKRGVSGILKKISEFFRGLVCKGPTWDDVSMHLPWRIMVLTYLIFVYYFVDPDLVVEIFLEKEKNNVIREH